MRQLELITYENLRDEELIKMIIKERSESDVSEKYLKDRNLVELVFDTTPEELISIGGKAKAQQLLAMQVMIKRLIQVHSKSKIKVSSPNDVFNYVRTGLLGLKRERFMILLLDTKNQIIREVEISLGTLNSSLVHPREVFREAVKTGTNSIILIHNHPSGKSSPSNEDKAITKRLCEAGQLLGIQVIDHIIVCESEYFSFKESGEM